MIDPYQLLINAQNALREGRVSEGLALIEALVAVDPDFVEAWWLLVDTTTNEPQKRNALNNIVRLNPLDDRATQMLLEMNEARLPPRFSSAIGGSSLRQSKITRPNITPGRSSSDPFANIADPFKNAPARSSISRPQETQKKRGFDPIPSSSGSAVEDPDGGGHVYGNFGNTPQKSPIGGGSGAQQGSSPFAQAPIAPPAVKSSQSLSPQIGGNTLGGNQTVRRSGGGCGCSGCITTLLILCGVLLGLTVFVSEEFGEGFPALIETNAPVVGTAIASGNLEDALNDLTDGAFNEVSNAVSNIASGCSVEESTTSPENLNETSLEAKGRIQLATEVTDSLGTSDRHGWKFTGTEGQELVIFLSRRNGDLDTYLQVYNPDDQLIAQNDDGAGDRNSCLNITLPEDGIYLILVRAYSSSTSGGYRLEIRER